MSSQAFKRLIGCDSQLLGTSVARCSIHISTTVHSTMERLYDSLFDLFGQFLSSGRGDDRIMKGPRFSWRAKAFNTPQLVLYVGGHPNICVEMLHWPVTRGERGSLEVLAHGEWCLPCLSNENNFPLPSTSVAQTRLRLPAYLFQYVLHLDTKYIHHGRQSQSVQADTNVQCPL